MWPVNEKFLCFKHRDHGNSNSSLKIIKNLTCAFVFPQQKGARVKILLLALES